MEAVPLLFTIFLVLLVDEIYKWLCSKSIWLAPKERERKDRTSLVGPERGFHKLFLVPIWYWFYTSIILGPFINY
jgi:hypothetical protein